MVDLDVHGLKEKTEDYQRKLLIIKQSENKNTFYVFSNLLKEEINACSYIINSINLKKNSVENVFEFMETVNINSFLSNVLKSKKLVDDFSDKLTSLKKEISNLESGAEKAKKVSNSEELGLITSFDNGSGSFIKYLDSEKDNLQILKQDVSSCIDALNLIAEENQKADKEYIDFNKRLNSFYLLFNCSSRANFASAKEYIKGVETSINSRKKEVFAPLDIIRKKDKFKRFFRIGVLAFLMSLIPLQSKESVANPDPGKNYAKTELAVESKKENNVWMSSERMEGVATHYADFFEGRPTLCGEIFSHSRVSCAVPKGSRFSPRNAPAKGQIMLLLVRSVKSGNSLVVPAYDIGNFGTGEDKLKYHSIVVDNKEYPRVVDLSNSARDILRGNGKEQNVVVEVVPIGWVSKEVARKYAERPQSNYFI